MGSAISVTDESPVVLRGLSTSLHFVQDVWNAGCKVVTVESQRWRRLHMNKSPPQTTALSEHACVEPGPTT